MAKLDRRDAPPVVLDLEDAVAPGSKPAARDVIVRQLPRLVSRVLTYVRVNLVDSADGDIDLDLVAGLQPHGVLVPKVETAGQVLTVAERLTKMAAPQTRILPMIESARGLRNIDDIAHAAPGRVQTLVLGTVDLIADLGLAPSDDERELLVARSSVVIAARSAKLTGPVDGPVLNLDPEGFDASCRASRRLGFGSRVCLTPAQAVDAVRAYTTLDPHTHEHLRALVTAFQEAGTRGVTVARVGSTFVDPPVYEAAQRALRRHEEFLLTEINHRTTKERLP